MVMKYDEKANMIEMNDSSSRENVPTITKYKYDKSGNVIEENSTGSYGLSIQMTYKYDKLDKVGNWLRKVSFNNNNASSLTEREIEYY
jgi:hypothetical protein